MGKKKREILWHKKRGKFVPSSLLKPHAASDHEDDVSGPGSRRKKFAQGLLKKIKKAVQQSSDPSA